MVTRITKEATYFLGNMTICASGHPHNAYQIWKMMGHELFYLGINMNLAPVLDVNNNATNPVNGVRSYGDYPETVGRFGVAFIHGLQEKVVLATGKHFPGHGDTTMDSHINLPLIPHDRKRLESVELYPFIQAIDNGIGAIMTAHVLSPAYEPNRLSTTLSKNVLTHLLRQKIKFNELIVTDCLEMKVIDDYYTTEQAAVLAIEACANVLSISHTGERQIAVYENILQAVETGRLSEEVIDRALCHVISVKERILEATLRFVKMDVREARQYFIVPEHQTFAQKIVDQALTLVGQEPYQPTNKKTLFLSPASQRTSIADERMQEENIVEAVKAHFSEWETLEIDLNPTDEVIHDLIEYAESFEMLIVGSYNANIYQGQQKLLKQLKRLSIPIHLIALRNPYDIQYSPQSGVCAYEYTPQSI